MNGAPGTYLSDGIQRVILGNLYIIVAISASESASDSRLKYQDHVGTELVKTQFQPDPQKGSTKEKAGRRAIYVRVRDV